MQYNLNEISFFDSVRQKHMKKAEHKKGREIEAVKILKIEAYNSCSKVYELLSSLGTTFKNAI